MSLKQQRSFSEKEYRKNFPRTTIKKRVLPHPDVWFVITILGILAFGVTMLFSASYYHSQQLYNDPFKLFIKQMLFSVSGIISMFFVGYFIDYRIFYNKKLTSFIYAVSVALTLSLPFIGKSVNGSTRWIDLGFATFQPSEIVKITVVLMTSLYLVENKKRGESKNKSIRFWHIAKALLIIGIPSFIVATENLSSGIIIAVTGVALLFVTTPGIWYYFVALIGTAFVGSGLYFAAIGKFSLLEQTLLKGYRMNRIEMWLDPWKDPLGKGYQTIQALYAVGSGGLSGVGFGQSIQKLGYLPEAHNDTIFAIICEELGLIGAGVLLMGYTLFVLRGFFIATKTKDLFGALISIGVVFLVGVQVVFNVLVNVNLIPTTGIQLPLVSYGGTGLVVLLSSLGIVLNVSRHANIRRIEV